MRLFPVFIILITLSWACRESNRQPLILIPFDGHSKTNTGMLPVLEAGISYDNFRQRKMLRLQPGAALHYEIGPLDLSEGALQFWLKMDSPPPPFALVLKFNTESERTMEVLLKKKFLSVRFEETEFQCTRQLPARDEWVLVNLTWKGSYLNVYLNGQQTEMLNTSAQEKGASFDLPDVHHLTVGANAGNGTGGEWALNLRDLRIGTLMEKAETIRARYQTENSEMSKPLVWSALDLKHFAGAAVPDEGARNGVCWTIDTLLARQRSVQLPAAGNYELAFRAKALNRVDAENLMCRVIASTNEQRATWKNAKHDLIMDGAFHTFTVPFTVVNGESVSYEFHSFIPAKGTVLLDTATIRQSQGRWQDTRRFEEMEHTMGVWNEDADAANGKGWINANTLTYGPYTCLGQPGRYRATWRFRIAEDVPDNTPFLMIDVYAHDAYLPGRRGTKAYVKQVLDTNQFPKRGEWQTQSLDFDYDGGNRIEFRAFARHMQPKSVFLDTVTVEPLALP